MATLPYLENLKRTTEYLNLDFNNKDYYGYLKFLLANEEYLPLTEDKSIGIAKSYAEIDSVLAYYASKVNVIIR